MFSACSVRLLPINKSSELEDEMTHRDDEHDEFLYSTNEEELQTPEDLVPEQTEAQVDLGPEVPEDASLDSLYGSEDTPVSSHEEERPDDVDVEGDDSAPGGLMSTVREAVSDVVSDAKDALGLGDDEERRAASWHLAPSLVRLRNEINARWPRRDKSSDGSVGDTSHRARKSDHNPNGRRSVNAIDIDKDGIDPYHVVRRAISHPSTNYVIFNRQIWARSRGFRPSRYTGPNPHNKHIHVSVRQSSSAENNTQGWGISGGGGGGAPTPVPSYPRYPGLLKRGSRGDAVRQLQQRLNARGYSRIPVDGDFGPATQDRVRRFQRFARISRDGKVGPVTWKALWVRPIT